MNILDLIRNNQFLKKMYPQGISDFFVGNIVLGIDNSITIALHTKEKPSIEIAKWGKWDVNYNIVVVEFSSFLPKNISITNWESIDKSPHKLIISEVTTNNYEVTITNSTMKIIIETDKFLFQKCETYIL